MCSKELAIALQCCTCMVELTDSQCLYASCGHIFCKNGGCTKLQHEDTALNGARCDVCDLPCNVANLDVLAYDDEHVRQYFYMDVDEKLETLRQVIQFRAEQHKIQVNASNELRKTMNALKREKSKLENEFLPNEKEQLRKAKELNKKLHREQENLRSALEKKTHKRTNPSIDSGGPSQHTADKYQKAPAQKHSQPKRQTKKAKAHNEFDVTSSLRIPHSQARPTRGRGKANLVQNLPAVGTGWDYHKRTRRTVRNALALTLSRPREARKQPGNVNTEEPKVRERKRADQTIRLEHDASGALAPSMYDYSTANAEVPRRFKRANEGFVCRSRNDGQIAHDSENSKANKADHHTRENEAKLKPQRLEIAGAFRARNRVKVVRENPEPNRSLARVEQTAIASDLHGANAKTTLQGERETEEIAIYHDDAKEMRDRGHENADKNRHAPCDQKLRDASKRNHRNAANVPERTMYGRYEQPRARQLIPTHKDRYGDFARRRVSKKRLTDEKRTHERRDAIIPHQAEKRSRAVKTGIGNTKLAVRNRAHFEPSGAAAKHAANKYDAPVMARQILAGAFQAPRHQLVVAAPQVVERELFARTGLRRRQSSLAPKDQRLKRRRVTDGLNSQAATLVTRKSQKGVDCGDEVNQVHHTPRRRTGENLRRHKNDNSRRQGGAGIEDRTRAEARRRFFEEDLLYGNRIVRERGGRMVARRR